MRRLFRILGLLLIGLLTVSMSTGCGGDSDSEVETPRANFVSATPPGGAIAVNATISITFDNTPTDVTVSVGSVTVVGKTAVVSGPFLPGPLALTITWADGTRTFNYTSTAPCCSSPHIIGGTVKDGDTDVDPETINSNGKIEIEFSEEVTGSIALETEAGEDVGWLGKVDGYRGILELVKGRELGNETTYVIVAKVSSTEGYNLRIRITFVTKGKA